MIPINLFDEIEIKEIDTDDDIIEFSPQIQMNGESTIHKALQCLRIVNNFEQKFHIKVKKNIPVEAGLGGGSSNAGSIIKYMATRYSPDYSRAGCNSKEHWKRCPFFR
jgi:4-diphosphocytidyl-2-C-methyl-D-erythritol kinase